MARWVENARPAPPASPPPIPPRAASGAARTGGLLLVALGVLVAGHLTMLNVKALCDESAHRDQIQRFLRGDFSQAEGLTVIPGYHAAIALGARLVGQSSLPWLRRISLGFSFLAVVAFLQNAISFEASSARLRTLQFLFLPIVFPYFFVLYTDIASLLCVLLMLLAARWDRPAAAGAFGAVSVLMRQNNIVWVAFTLLVLLLAWGGRSGTPRGNVLALLRGRASVRAVGAALAAYGPFLLTFLGFAAFVAARRDVAMADTSHHPFPEVHFGNVYYLLFHTFLLFLPLHVANAPLVLRRVRARPVLTALLLLAFYLVYLYTFVNDHEYNQIPRFLRNRVLMFASQDVWHKTLFFLPIALAVLSLSVVRLRERTLYLLYPFAVLYLLPSWLIEDRYCIIPVTLFLLFVETQAKVVEYAKAILYPAYLLVILPLQVLLVVRPQAFP